MMEPEIYATIKFKVKADHDLTEKAYEVRCTPPDGLPRLNFEQQWVENIPIYNMRPLLPELSLDTQGFVAVELSTKMAYEDFFREEKLRTVYSEEIREHLKNYLGASCIFFHECVIRKRDKTTRKVDSKSGFGQPVVRAHGGKQNYTLGEVEKLLGQLGGPRLANELKTRRFQALNIWKPLRGPVKDWPLALCDLRSVDPVDLIPFDEVYIDDVLESYQVHHNSDQKWFYLSEQKSEEVLIFKSADSWVEGTVPHCSFSNPYSSRDEPGRESIELRALVIY